MHAFDDEKTAYIDTYYILVVTQNHITDRTIVNSHEHVHNIHTEEGPITITVSICTRRGASSAL